MNENVLLEASAGVYKSEPGHAAPFMLEERGA